MEKILIIDDEKNFCAIIKAGLGFKANYDVLIATSGKEGIRSAKKNRPDLILLDITMPKMDGFEVLKILKASRETMSIPVIMLTARSDKEYQEKAMSLYDEDYIVKPVDIEVLKSKIENVLARFKSIRT